MNGIVRMGQGEWRLYRTDEGIVARYLARPAPMESTAAPATEPVLIRAEPIPVRAEPIPVRAELVSVRAEPVEARVLPSTGSGRTEIAQDERRRAYRGKANGVVQGECSAAVQGGYQPAALARPCCAVAYRSWAVSEMNRTFPYYAARMPQANTTKL